MDRSTNNAGYGPLQSSDQQDKVLMDSSTNICFLHARLKVMDLFRVLINETEFEWQSVTQPYVEISYTEARTATVYTVLL